MNESLEKIDKYRILKRLGEGGFGAVYLCHDHDMERDVAIKVFRPRDENLVAFATSSSEDGLQVLRERFKREARILARLHDNPYIVSALEFGETENGSPWYAMDYVPDNLQQRLGKDVFDRAGLDELDQSAHPRALPLEQCLTLLHQVLQGMKAAHAHGLVHRDIKPSNILLSDAGEVRIADFGIAKEPDTQISVSRVAMGSRNYMAPEQRESAKHVDRRADIYSIGVLAYRMLTGKLPAGRYADPEVVVPQLGKALNEVILKAFEEDKDKRFRDAGEMLEAYEAALQLRAREDKAGTYTGTFTDLSIDSPVSGPPKELRPLYEIIEETLLEHGTITPRQREIEAMAAVLKIDGKAMQSIVVNVTATHKEIPAVQELLNLIEREMGELPAQTAGKETQAQTERLIGDLLPAAKLAGKDRAWLEARMQVTLGEQERSSPRTAPHTASKQAADSSYTEPAKRSFLLQASVVFAVVAVSVVGLWFWAGYGVKLYPVTITSNVTDARITLRGNGNDYTYQNGLRLPAGSYQISATAERYSPLSEIWQVSENNTRLNIVLEQVLYPVTITSNVTDARITLRGNSNDYTYRNGLRLPAGSYQVSAMAERYSPLSEIWQVSENNTRLVLELESIVPEPGGTFRDPLADGGEGPLMVVLPAGRFAMGCLSNDSDCFNDEQPVHDVTLPNNFAMAVYEVTFAEYDRYVQATGVRRPDDRGWGRGNRPVIDVDWEEARAYARWLSEQTGHSYRLPTEAEWEYAARAGTTTKYSWGNEATPEQANYSGNDRWENTAPVGSFPANGFGLYDMHGNVREWTQDCWHRSYDGAPTNGQAWEGANGGDCDRRVVRGGSWFASPGNLRAANRDNYRVSHRGINLGLRLVQDLP